MMVTLSSSLDDIDKLIKSVKAYKENFNRKVEILRERLTEYGAYVARIEFTNAFYAGENDVEIEVKHEKNRSIILAKGEAVGFIEFGTGVMNPDHPLKGELGIPDHGTYGQGKGKNRAWAYYGKQGTAGRFLKTTKKGDLFLTQGNPPASAMYIATREIRDKLPQMIKEVFS